ncbi:hypothetical protein B0O80DRAFT_98341 [Mortierella sp. GBAus27b]|nr:hypothetical protein B0O80DRAFT_98341 [Mortierella sp. GBAus27b]
MNSKLFEEYFESLCRHCQKKDLSKVVFCMDNAKYHRCGYQDSESHGAQRKSLSQLNKGELIVRLLERGANMDELQGLKRDQLYKAAQQPKYTLPLAVEVIAKKYDMDTAFYGFLRTTRTSTR